MYKGLVFQMVVLSFLFLMKVQVQAMPLATVEGIEYEGEVFIPLRQTCEQMGLDVRWDRGGGSVQVWQQDKLSGEMEKVFSTGNEAPALIIQNRIYVALEAFTQELSWYYVQTEENEYAVFQADGVDTANMMALIDHVSRTPRLFGEPEIVPARQLITEMFLSYGYEVVLQEFTQEFDDGTVKTGYNIIATKYADSMNSTEDIFIVGAHYDTVEGAPGANDNGSGLAALMEVARLVKDVPSDTEVRFIAFDGEEYLLLGSHYYAGSLTAEELPRVVGMINFDMFAADEISGMYIGTVDGKHNEISEMFEDFELITKIFSDHVSFVSLGIPVVEVSHPAESRNHTPADTADYIDEYKLYRGAAEGLAVLCHYMGSGTPSFMQQKTVRDISVYEMNLLDLIDFNLYTDKDVFDEAFNISETVTVPVQTAEPFAVQRVYAAMVDWFGLPLETHFVYGFSALSHIEIMLDKDTAPMAALLLDENRIAIEDPSSYAVLQYQMEGQKIQKAWKDGQGTGYVLSEAEEGNKLTMLDYRGKTVYGINHMGTSVVIGDHNEIWKMLKPLLDEAGLTADVAIVEFIHNSYGDDILLNLSQGEGGLTITVAVNEILEETGRLYQQEDFWRQFAYAAAEYIFKGECPDGAAAFLNRFYSDNSSLAAEILSEIGVL